MHTDPTCAPGRPGNRSPSRVPRPRPERRGGFALTFVPTLSERVSVSVMVAGRGDALVLDAGEVRVVPRIPPLHRPARPRRHGARPAGLRTRAAARARVEVPPAARGTHAEGPRRRPHLPRGRAADRARRELRRPVPVAGGCRAPGPLPGAVPAGPGSPLEAAQAGWQHAGSRIERMLAETWEGPARAGPSGLLR